MTKTQYIEFEHGLPEDTGSPCSILLFNNHLPGNGLAAI